MQRLINYYLLSNLINTKNSYIYNSILKYGHNNYSLFILEVCCEKGKPHLNLLLDRERFYLSWALRMSGNKVLNIRPVRGYGQRFRLSNEVVLKFIGKNHN